ncbi:MAG: hypothetical protein SVZ03_15305 [Spirochaetota bacterium]|nr:hypothetical protein [Spirochaetota bacterium]
MLSSEQAASCIYNLKYNKMELSFIQIPKASNLLVNSRMTIFRFFSSSSLTKIPLSGLAKAYLQAPFEKMIQTGDTLKQVQDKAIMLYFRHCKHLTINKPRIIVLLLNYTEEGDYIPNVNN